ncbi:1,4-alpha-glucan branching protein GlgB [Lyngbya confervoides]|uniref:1,4-alpha-glucan branching enzyme GlgB n=1 Tax=Lyngbya confervoides BDU141951 TaxID=1574623 RepID=A0ABD4T5G4_9CYAN|nr:1,4-alpha-glucan branching protein GlgB [Lyngbya confervoides]MCM1983834.1 1,4-alpha-glucan branching protein GlgB [Lyngbya confervoides BDU141951]
MYTEARIPAETIYFQSADLEAWRNGTYYHSYEKLGAHVRSHAGQPGVYFAVWAPHAQAVSVVGDFNGWQFGQHPMARNEAGIWELFIPGLQAGEKYKYAIQTGWGEVILKTDPYGHQQELRPDTASLVADLSYRWSDEAWLTQRRQRNPQDLPISVYEVHLGSWLHDSLDNPPSEQRSVPVTSKPGARHLTYRELGDRLIPYIQEMGFTHIELLPITEHPFDGSWGYQVVGFFAPTSRYGTPQDFMAFVDRCHQAGIGVIIDWVPGHFPKDGHGLARFDGSTLFEYPDPRKGEHKGWGTLVFDYGKPQVCNFLLSSALFWLEKYHIDGIRVDAVASMLYLDYDREEWLPNQYGGRENLEAVAFLRHLNEKIFEQHPGILSIAEESTAWEKVSHPTYAGGLGFNFKWNMGWMNDTLRYFQVHPQDRSNHHGSLTFSLWYAFSEHFMLSLSHDEVVHGKGHLFQKMPGDDRQKLANLRSLLGYLFTHPGKKTLFMGMEFGQTREWNVEMDLDWWLLDHDPHRQIHQLVQDLNRVYRQESALYAEDFSSDGFEWIDCNDQARGLISFIRKDPATGESVVVVCNFKPNQYRNYWLGVREPGRYEERINTDAACYGGDGLVHPQPLETRAWEAAAWPYALEVNVPAIAVVMFKLQSPQQPG